MARLALAFLLGVTASEAVAEDRFRIHIDIDADASAKLVEQNRWMVIEAHYSGEARPGVPASDWGIASLGRASFYIYPVSQVVEFGGSLAAMPADWTDEVRVWVELTTEGSPETPELILCDTMERPLRRLVEDSETTLECMLRGD